MKTVVLGSPPPELESFIARRRALGLDRHDEVWDGEYHVAPEAHAWHGMVSLDIMAVLRPAARAVGLHATNPFNLGTSKDDFRVPDGGLHRGVPDAVWVPTAALVLEVQSPHDETWQKFGFYARREVDEVVVADPATRTIHWFVRSGPDGYDEVTCSPLLGLSVADVTAAVDWPG